MRELGLGLGQGQLYPGQVDRRESGGVRLAQAAGGPLHHLLALPRQQLGQELSLRGVQSGQLTAVPAINCHLSESRLADPYLCSPGSNVSEGPSSCMKTGEKGLLETASDLYMSYRNVMATNL